MPLLLYSLSKVLQSQCRKERRNITAEGTIHGYYRGKDGSLEKDSPEERGKAVSAPKYRYYFEARKRILGYKEGRKPAGVIGFIYDHAIELALSDVDKLPDAEARRKIIDYVLMRGGSVDAASIKYHYSCRSVSRIIAHFMGLVIHYVNAE